MSSPLKKLNAVSKAWTQKDKEDFSRGASKAGSLDLPKPKKAMPVDRVPQGEMAEIDASIERTQKANLADPSKASRLEKVNAARAKFFGK